MTVTLAALSLGVWLYLLLGRGFFWLARVPAAVSRQQEREGAWPGIVAIVPARNEAAVVGEAVGSLLAQDYPARFSVVMVDDHSDDNTAAIARAAAARLGKSEGLHVLSARALPQGWSGKLWALSEGVRHVEASDEPPELFLFTDADVAHHPENLRELAARLSHEGRDLVSLMVLLRCRNSRRALPHPGLRLLLRQALPFRLGQRSAAFDGGRGGRLRADQA